MYNLNYLIKKRALMNGHVYEGTRLINSWSALLITKIEEMLGKKLGYRPSNIGPGLIKEKTVFRRFNPSRLFGSGGSGNYQFAYEPTLLLDVDGIICEITVSKGVFDQLS